MVGKRNAETGDEVKDFHWIEIAFDIHTEGYQADGYETSDFESDEEHNKWESLVNWFFDSYLSCFC